MTTRFPAFYLSLMIGTATLLSACGNTANNTPQLQISNNTPTPVVDKQMSEATPMNNQGDASAVPAETNQAPVPTEEENVAEILDPMMEETITLSELNTYVNDFKYNDEPTFLSCSESSILNCQNQVATQMGLDNKNANACDSISDQETNQNCKNQLWMQLATMETDTDLCNNITDEFSKTSCTDQTLNRQAQEEQNIDLCDNISDPFQQDSCKNQVRTSLAVAAADPALCDAVVQFEYETVFPEQVENEDGEIIDDTAMMEGELVKTPVEDDQNFERQNCLIQIEMQQDMLEMQAAEAAAQAEAEAAAAAAANEEAVEEATQ